MAIKEVEFIWMDGEFIHWEDAKIHILSHVIHYGSSAYEGLRAYETPKGIAIFRLKDHIKRLFESAKIYRMEIPYTKDEITAAIKKLIQKNKLKKCYIRPIVYRGFNELGVNPLNCPVKMAIAVWEWGKYLGTDALEKGVDVMVSSWRRMAPGTLPATAKVGANYMNSQLIKMEAIINGYIEGIALDYFGFLSEGSGENLFLVRDGKIYTPSIDSSILIGITRDSIIKIANALRIPVLEERIPREYIYTSDEAFFSGSAAEITPIRSVDKIVIGNGTRGPITKKIQDELLGIAEGKREDKFGWLEFI
ncbi:branched-chain amino acid transaminase [candidate division WOR-3 bacterium]|nr:branched-chain amino acid transaminase [candidate division WOR-3 bacterium]